MLTAITYNCDPESLDSVTATEFAEAFENEVRAYRPSYRDLAITVTFDVGSSGVTVYKSDDPDVDLSHADEFDELFGRLAERAFTACHS